MSGGATVVRVWNDRYAYKKMFVLQGLDSLRRAGTIELLAEPYEAFESRGAPERIGEPYHSHKNLVVFEVSRGEAVVRCVYDANDIYYKIPPSLLSWCDLYFKSNFQEPYLREGRRMTGPYWDRIPVIDALLPEPVDATQFYKFRPANFSMELHGSFWRNRWYFQCMEGRWLRSRAAAKRADVFFLGRYWAETKTTSLALIDHVKQSGRSLIGGLVEAKDPVPEPYRKWMHRAVGLDRWCRMAADARVPLITRGLQGCVGFKPLNLLMLGAPIFANRLMSNLRVPLLEGTNYVAVADDFSDLAEKLTETSDADLESMGRANFEHWKSVASPKATARWLVEEALVALENR